MIGIGKVREIVEGWRNELIPPADMKDAINQMSSERMAICRACPSNSINKGISYMIKVEHCTICGCPLVSKTKSPTSQCPLDPPAWESYMSMSDYEKLSKQ